MGVLTLDSYIRKTYKKAVRYYRPGQKIYGRFKCLGLDANPFVYAAVYRAFETGPCFTMIPQNNNLSYEEKIQLVMDYTWEQIEEIINVVDTEEVYIAFDGVAPVSKQAQQRCRRYGRDIPQQGDFDLCMISTGTRFLHDLCTYIRHRIHQRAWSQRVIFSSHNVPGEGEHKIMDHFRKFSVGTKVCMFGPDGDLIMLGLSSNLDFHLFKVDHKTQFTSPRYYTIHINTIKAQISGGRFNTDKIDSFVFLGFVLGNDFVPRLEIFHLFFDGIVDLYKYVEVNIINRKRLDRGTFKNLLVKLAKDEPNMLARRTEYAFPLLEKYTFMGELDFDEFRKEYYREWVGIEKDKDINNMALNYLDTLWWNWLYYTQGCPTFDHCYNYHYPPFVCDLLAVFDTWRIPRFKKSEPRRPFHQLCAIMPKNRKHLLPKKYHCVFDGSDYPDPQTIKINTEGRHEEFEAVYEVPLVKDLQVDIEHKHYHARNRVDQDRVFQQGSTIWKYKTRWGILETQLEG